MNAQLLGTRTFKKLLDSIKMRIGRHNIMVEIYEGEITKSTLRTTGEDEDDVANAKFELEEIQGLMTKAKAAIEELEKSYTMVVKEWGKPSQDTIGHICSFPLIALNVVLEGFTEN